MQQEINYNTEENNQPVTVLGKTFTNDDERREWFRNELRKQLPELKEMEGYPIGEDEDIIKLSDPPYYTACPNPWLNDFIEEWEKEKKELEKQGKRIPDDEFIVEEPYASDVSEGKNNPIYNAHSYHTKVPHPAIMRYIMHYTQPGDIVFDGFAGTGMTGVAASMCANPESDIKQKIENENATVKWGKRNAICSDLSTLASFIASKFNNKINAHLINKIFLDKLNEVYNEISYLYTTKHKSNEIGSINYTVWSFCYECPECLHELDYWETAIDHENGYVKKEFNCPNCNSLLKKTNLILQMETIDDLNKVRKKAKLKPVLINYTYRGKRYEKKPDEYDIQQIQKANKIINTIDIPVIRMPDGDESRRNDKFGFYYTNDFYTDRNLLFIHLLWEKFSNNLKFFLTSVVGRNLCHLNRYIFYKGKGGIGRPMSGTLYISSEIVEQNPYELLKSKLLKNDFPDRNIISTASATKTMLEKNSIDYIFTDPPFGANIMYSELNFLTESWLKVLTNNTKEAIENKTQDKDTLAYQYLMQQSFKEYFKVLKPGKWMTVEFSNTSSAVWNSIRTALQNAGFIIADISALDKKHGGIRAMFYAAAVKQDLIISCYKPSNDFDIKFQQTKFSEVGIWDFIEEHLMRLPVHIVRDNATTAIVERSPKILFDRLIAFYVTRNLPVPIDAQAFQKGLRERFIERDGMFFNPEQVEEYDRKKAEVPEFVQLSLFVANEQDAIYWLRQKLEEPKTEQDLHPMWMTEVAGNMRKGDTLPEMRNILEENFLRGENGKWYIPDMENEADLERVRTRKLLRTFDEYKEVISKPRVKIKEVRVEALRAGFKQCYQDKDFATIIAIGDRIPNNLLMEDEVLLQYYDIASSRV
jgi:DNA modification methylase